MHDINMIVVFVYVFLFFTAYCLIFVFIPVENKYYPYWRKLLSTQSCFMYLPDSYSPLCHCYFVHGCLYRFLGNTILLSKCALSNAFSFLCTSIIKL